jgi:hypothetical protein
MIAAKFVQRPAASRLPPELLGSVPRDVRLTSSGIAVVVTAIAIAIGALVSAIVMSVAYGNSEAERQLREREGVTSDAEVVQVAVIRGDRTRRDITYRYDVDGRSYTGRVRLRQRDRDIARGDPIRIRYLTSRPETSWPIADARSKFPLWTIPLTALSLLLTAAAVARSVRRQWVLLSEGRVAQARVTGTAKVRTDKGTAYRVSYEFRTLSGATQTSRCTAGKTPPPIGTVIPIVYHRDKPRWSAAYPLQLVRPRRFVN